MKSLIRDYIQNTLASGKAVSDSDDLLLSGLVDSLGVMQLVAFLEQETGAPIPPEDVTIDHFESIDAIDAYMASRAR